MRPNLSPLRPDKARRSSTSPKEEQTQYPDGPDEALNLSQIKSGHHTLVPLGLAITRYWPFVYGYSSKTVIFLTGTGYQKRK
jgi:hypothetical protein